MPAIWSYHQTESFFTLLTSLALSWRSADIYIPAISSISLSMTALLFNGTYLETCCLVEISITYDDVVWRGGAAFVSFCLSARVLYSPVHRNMPPTDSSVSSSHYLIVAYMPRFSWSSLSSSPHNSCTFHALILHKVNITESSFWENILGQVSRGNTFFTPCNINVVLVAQIS